MRPTQAPRRLTFLTLLLIAALTSACDDDGREDDPRDIITGDTSTSDTSTPDAGDTATLPGDTSDTAVDVPEDVPEDVPDDGVDLDAEVDGDDQTDTSPTCGNGIVDDGELCDGTDLAGADCGDHGFDGGTLVCNATCDGVDTSGCTRLTCGNGQLDAGEDCEGTELDGATCASEGFTGGTLACAANCALDTSGCFTCGNDLVEPGELCDGDDLDGATCGTSGFDGGTLACASDCQSLDTASCTTCGDDTIEGDEVCDGDALGGADCQSEGFDGGTLACAADCSALDTTACTTASCGNGALDAGEDCDGANLDGQTCEGLGFGGGTLGCTGNCQFQTTLCDPCGNDVIEGTEACDGSDLAGLDCQMLGYDSGTLACGSTCDFDLTGCVRAPHPGIGEIIVTEVMQNPNTLSDAAGEWFELYNTTSTTLSLNGCHIGGQTDRFDVLGAPALAPGAYYTFAVDSANGPGFTPDSWWLPATSFNLANSSDSVHVMCPDGAGGDLIIDAVLWDDGATFPDPDGASMQLDPDAFDATANGIGANWCESTQSYNGDFGTPGAANDECASPVTIDFCRLQFPTTIDGEAGQSTTVYGRLYIAGLTDQTTGNDTHPRLVAELGYGADGTDPATDPSWQWQSAAPNPGYTASGNDEDEYQATLTHPVAAGSPYDFAYRFSGDSGQTWTLCDSGAGSSDGYAAADAGQMTTTPSTVSSTLFFSEYVEGSSNNKAVEIFNTGATAVDLSACAVWLWVNGSDTTHSTISLSGMLAAGDTFVLCHTSANMTLAPLCDATSGSLQHTGNDAVELNCGGATVDAIGRIGENPASGEWGTGDASTSNNTLRRKCGVTSGDTSGADAFDPAVEWDGHPVDTFDGLGSHSISCP